MIKRNFPINLLGYVQRHIRKQEYFIRKFLGNKINESGYKVSSYSDLEKRRASIQPIVSTQYKSLGLDFTKVYIAIYDTKYIETLDRNNNSDEIIYNNWIYHPIANQKWFEMSSWNSVLAVRVKKYD